jgi:hypothetical protein
VGRHASVSLGGQSGGEVGQGLVDLPAVVSQPPLASAGLGDDLLCGVLEVSTVCVGHDATLSVVLRKTFLFGY